VASVASRGPVVIVEGPEVIEIDSREQGRSSLGDKVEDGGGSR
jgi:hypothetical protein